MNPGSERRISKGNRVWRYSRPVLVGAVVTAVLLLGARIAAPHVLQRYVNDKLDESPDYAGQVGDIDIALLVGGYRIENVEITKTEGEVPVPLFAAREVEFSVLWKALLNGAVVGETVMHEPQINIVDSDDESRKQTGAGGQWLSMFEDLFPLQVDKAVIHNGQLHFRNYDSEPQMDIYLSELEATAENLSNRQALTESSIARVDVAARAMEVSDLTVGAAFDPTTEKPTFDVNVKLLQLPVSRLDNFIRTYAPFDVEAGEVDVVSELAARDGQLEGYVKPIIYNLDVFNWKDDIREDDDGPLTALWEGLVDVVAEIFENQPRDQIASNIPLRGDISDPDTNVFVAVAGVFKNAFVEAYQANLENTVSLFIDDEDIDVDLPPPLLEGVQAPEKPPELAAAETAAASAEEPAADSDEAPAEKAPPEQPAAAETSAETPEEPAPTETPAGPR